MMKMTSIGTGASSVGGSGTVRWQAPELIDGDNENVRSTKASDIYAVAGVFYEVNFERFVLLLVVLTTETDLHRKSSIL